MVESGKVLGQQQQQQQNSAAGQTGGRHRPPPLLAPTPLTLQGKGGKEADEAGGKQGKETEAGGTERPALRTHREAHAGWEDENFQQRPRESGDDDHVYVDAHLLCTPAVADIDGDGKEELVLSVSYFFDREYYDNPAHSHELDPSIDMSKYVAGGV